MGFCHYPTPYSVPCPRLSKCERVRRSRPLGCDVCERPCLAQCSLLEAQQREPGMSRTGPCPAVFLSPQFSPVSSQPGTTVKQCHINLAGNAAGCLPLCLPIVCRGVRRSQTASVFTSALNMYPLLIWTLSFVPKQCSITVTHMAPMLVLGCMCNLEII